MGVLGKKDPIFFFCFYVREEEGEEESTQVFFLRSLEFHWSEFVESRTKVHCLDKGYACSTKSKEFHRRSK